MRKAFALMVIDYDNTRPLACYSDKTAAEKEAERLEQVYKDTYPAFNAWCKSRWTIVEQWQLEGKTTTYGLPSEEGEAAIVKMIGPNPSFEGHESCDVWEIEDRRSEKG